MAAKVNNTFKNRHEYVPPSVQKTMSQHIERTLPPHLKKYQQAGSYVPEYAERAIAGHVQKNLPTHLKKYSDAYVQQNVIQPSLSRPVASTGDTPNPPSGSNMPNLPGQNRRFSLPGQKSKQPPSPTPAALVGDGQYDFILNPEKQKHASLFFVSAGKTQKILIVTAGAILLITLTVVLSSLFSRSSNAQNEKLISLAKTQNEIIRIIDESNEKVTDQDLRNFSINAKLSLASTKQEVVASLAERGKKVKDKDISSANGRNDQILSEGEQNSRFSETYRQLLEKELSTYQSRLKSVYDSGNKTEKEFSVSANSQINLLLGKKQASSNQ